MRQLLLVLFIISTGLLFAQPLAYPNQPVATTDDFLAAKLNPAALGYGNSAGITYLNLMEDQDFKNHYQLFFNMQGVSYVLDNDDNKVNYHTLAFGNQVSKKGFARNLYTGWSWEWTNSKYNKGNLAYSILYRPSEIASLAWVGKWYNNDDKNYKFTSPDHRLGIGIRPFFLTHLAPYSLELTADTDYRNLNDPGQVVDRSFSKPTVGINTQLIPGVKIGGSYDAERETWGLNFSLTHRKMSVGGLAYNNDDWDNSYGYSYVSLCDKEFKPLGFLPNKKSFYNLNIKQVVDQKTYSQIGFITIGSNKKMPVRDLVNRINQLSKDDNIGGILIYGDQMAIGLAYQQELNAAIRDFKATGKKVAFYFNNISNGQYVFAAANADKIYLNPLGSVDLKGLAITTPYFRELLDTLGVDVYNYQSHKYKTAFNMFSEKEMTAAERESYDSLLGSLYDEMTRMIQEGRGSRLSKPIKQLIDDGPFYSPSKILQTGLVDGMLYQDELNDQLQKDFGFKKVTSTTTEKANYNWTVPNHEKIAVIYATGNIVMGKTINGKQFGPKEITDMIRAAAKNPEIKGIVLRVDSGGGSAQASDIILREIDRIKKGKNAKPIVVSMGSVAGSGGYYISADADKIIANPTTITGSIGVISVGFSAERLFDKIHVNWSTVKKGAHSDFGSISRKPESWEKRIYSESVSEIYDGFINIVARGRKMNVEAVHEIAQGRVWTGKQALDLGLVDKLGGLQTAVDEVKLLAKIKGEADLVIYPKVKNGLLVNMDTDGIPFMGASTTLPQEATILKNTYDNWREYGQENSLMLMPLDINSIQQ